MHQTRVENVLSNIVMLYSSVKASVSGLMNFPQSIDIQNFINIESIDAQIFVHELKQWRTKYLT